MKKKESKTGVYYLENLITGKFYIGSTAIRFQWRFNAHLSGLRLGNHPNKILQNSFNKYGAEAFQFGILEYVKPENCIERVLDDG